MEEKTADEIAAIFKAAGDNVNAINLHSDYSAYKASTKGYVQTETEWKNWIKSNVTHLELIKAYKKLDKKTSIWTSESFTDIDAAITKGKNIYS